MARRSGLGKGLGALIPRRGRGSRARRRACASSRSAQIEPNPNQPRTHFDEETLVSLTASIAELGVLQPVLVRSTGPDRYELIAGERRWRAAKRAGLQNIPAVVAPDRRRRLARAGGRREPAPPGPQPARRGCRLHAVDRGLQPVPRRRCSPGRQEPLRGVEHAAAAAVVPRHPAPGRRWPADRRPRPSSARHAGSFVPGSAGPSVRCRVVDGPRRRGRRSGSFGGTRRRGRRRRGGAGALAVGHGRGRAAASAGPASNSRSFSRTVWTRGSRSRWGPSVARSRSTSRPSKIWNGSIER